MASRFAQVVGLAPVPTSAGRQTSPGATCRWKRGAPETPRGFRRRRRCLSSYACAACSRRAGHDAHDPRLAPVGRLHSWCGGYFRLFVRSRTALYGSFRSCADGRRTTRYSPPQRSHSIRQIRDTADSERSISSNDGSMKWLFMNIRRVSLSARSPRCT